MPSWVNRHPLKWPPSMASSSKGKEGKGENSLPPMDSQYHLLRNSRQFNTLLPIFYMQRPMAKAKARLGPGRVSRRRPVLKERVPWVRTRFLEPLPLRLENLWSRKLSIRQPARNNTWTDLQPEAPMQITVLGAGRMGNPMARNLMESGHQICVYNRSPGK